MFHLTAQEKKALQLFKERLLEQLPDQIEELKLFGSKARGEASKFSDVDVFILLKHGDWRVHEPIQQLSAQVMIETDVDLSLHIFTRDQINQLRALHSPFLRHVEAEGITV